MMMRIGLSGQAVACAKAPCATSATKPPTSTCRAAWRHVERDAPMFAVVSMILFFEVAGSASLTQAGTECAIRAVG